MANGDRCEGVWEENKLIGKAKYTNLIGEVYNGDWATNINLDNIPALSQTSNNLWANDVREGHGTYIWSNNDRYSG